jgi:hypothetical protein
MRTRLHRLARNAAREARQGFDAVVGRGELFTHQPLGNHIKADSIHGYYCDFRHKALYAMRDDPDGFPQLHYMIDVSQAALGYWELILEGHELQKPFLALADWLVDNAVKGSPGLVWHGPYAMPKYDLAIGWPSAMGQGEAISVLLRAHRLTGSEQYLETAVAAFEPMTVDVALGGVQRNMDGHIVLEEYPTRRPAAVLNGWIFALLGIHELALVTGDEAVRNLFDRSEAGLVSMLPRYDVGWWSLYSLYPHGRPDLAKPFYQRLHPVLLDALNLVRPEQQLHYYARRWEAQLTPVNLARNAVDKVAFRCWREYNARR